MELKKHYSFIKIRVLHINYNSFKHSSDTVKHCIQLCKKNNLELIIKNIKKIPVKKNFEEVARVIRYNIIKKVLIPKEVVITAHHLNDQCETFFLSLKRGSGPTGLSGMKLNTFLDKDKLLIRPFLDISKKQIEHFANKKKLIWITDHSNNNIYYDRNFLRKEIIPILEKRWPFFLKTCFRSSTICSDYVNIANNLANNFLQKNMLLDSSLNFFNMLFLDVSIRKVILRNWFLKNKLKMPSYSVIEKILKEVINSKKDANPKIIINQFEIRRYKKYIYIFPVLPSVNSLILIWHNINCPLQLPYRFGFLENNSYGMKIPSPKKNDIVNIRFIVSGRISIFGRNGSRQVKKIFQEFNIPPWYRNRIPLIFYNSDFIAAPGIFLVDCIATKRNKKSCFISWNSMLLNNT
ncbi:tRNA lysidine(34) synthetase TilS [Buchnera aphidicola (Anoecia oenotherae)]|uniref:tRNA(Ile)-lysidine synthase n=2 Tax=Buchnera aphidicola TaxID=9 RepID=A0A4D6XXP0_9GAMM|nr:tRNA lysidine(34) synthetase TilS [Buchnera aphidicola (Anoecia oenotherae)]